MAPHSNTLAWKIPWMEEPGRLQSMRSLRVGHDFTFTFHFHELEKEKATHSSVLAWRIPGTEEPDKRPSMGSQSRTRLKQLSSSSSSHFQCHFQCLISTLTQGGGGGHFFRLTCQACCGEGGTLQTNITGVCGECSQCFSCTGFAPTHSLCTFMVYTSQALGCSARNGLRQVLGCMHFPGLSRLDSGSWVFHQGADLVGPVFCALSRSEQLR